MVLYHKIYKNKKTTQLLNEFCSDKMKDLLESVVQLELHFLYYMQERMKRENFHDEFVSDYIKDYLENYYL